MPYYVVVGPDEPICSGVFVSREQAIEEAKKWLDEDFESLKRIDTSCYIAEIQTVVKRGIVVNQIGSKEFSK